MCRVINYKNLNEKTEYIAYIKNFNNLLLKIGTANIFCLESTEREKNRVIDEF